MRVTHSQPASCEKEFRLLRAAATARPDAAALSRIRELSRGHVDWVRFAKLADSHGISQIVWASLQKAAVPVSSPVGEQARMAFRARGCEAIRMTGELVRVLELLRKESIRAIPIKGPALAAAAYGNLSLRLSVDLDILVDPADAPRAGRILASIGYRGWEWAPSDDAARLRADCEQMLVCAERRVIVDLHWALAPSVIEFPVTFDQLWIRAEPVSLGGTLVRTLSREDLLMFLCLHGAKHRWEQFGLVCDLAELLRASPDLNWAWILSRSAELGMQRMLFLGLHLAIDLRGAQVPKRMRKALGRDATAKLIAQRTAKALMESQGPLESEAVSQARKCLFILQARERIRDRVRYCLAALRPTARDLNTVRLPAGWKCLQAVIRPFRIFLKHGRAASMG